MRRGGGGHAKFQVKGAANGSGACASWTMATRWSIPFQGNQKACVPCAHAPGEQCKLCKWPSFPQGKARMMAVPHTAVSSGLVSETLLERWTRLLSPPSPSLPRLPQPPRPAVARESRPLGRARAIGRRRGRTGARGQSCCAQHTARKGKRWGTRMQQRWCLGERHSETARIKQQSTKHVGEGRGWRGEGRWASTYNVAAIGECAGARLTGRLALSCEKCSRRGPSCPVFTSPGGCRRVRIAPTVGRGTCRGRGR